MVEIKQLNGPESILLYDKNDLVDAIAYALYYSVNPDSKMCIPNCAYFKAETMLKKWEEEKNDSRKSK